MKHTATAGAGPWGLSAASGGVSLACAPGADATGAALALAVLCLLAAAAAVLVARSRARRAADAERALAAERRARLAAEDRLRTAADDLPAPAEGPCDDARHAHLAEMDRMASIGLLASSIVHDMAQPLGYALDSVRFAREELDRPQPALLDVRAALAEAQEGGEQVRRILGEVRAYALGAEDPDGAAEVAPVVESALRIAAAELRHRARVTIDVRPVPPVALAPHRLAQVVLNLVVNAAQAIPSGDPARNEVRVRAWRDGDAVVLEIADTGAGIPEDVRPRLFEPFFTTKPAGVGTGLGLPIVRRLVSCARGSIEIESTAGGGTTAVVRLPVALSAARAAAAPDPEPGRGRILVIDDEAEVARILVRALETEHEVHAESDPERALARLRSGEDFDVIFCDVVMPTLDGLSVHDALEKVRPSLAERFVFLTGAGRSGSASIASVGRIVVEKPFDLDEVRAVARARVRAARQTQGAASGRAGGGASGARSAPLR